MSLDINQIMSDKATIFRSAIKTTYDQWQSFKIALQQTTLPVVDFSNWLVSSTETFFAENEDLNGDEVADWLDEIIDTELDVQIRDGSLEQVGMKLCTYFRLINQDDMETVNKMLQEPLPPPPQVSYNTAGGDSDSSDYSD